MATHYHCDGVGVLLAACANLGGLFAARTADRTREIAIRLAVGSSRWRILRHVLAEALVVSILGGAVACGLAWIALAGLAKWHPPSEYPLRFTVEPQPLLVLIALLVSVLAGALTSVLSKSAGCFAARYDHGPFGDRQNVLQS